MKKIIKKALDEVIDLEMLYDCDYAKAMYHLFSGDVTDSYRSLYNKYFADPILVYFDLFRCENIEIKELSKKHLKILVYDNRFRGFSFTFLPVDNKIMIASDLTIRDEDLVFGNILDEDDINDFFLE